MNKWTIKILRFPLVYRTLQATRNIRLPGFEGITLWQVLRLFIIGISRGQITTRAASVCFFLLLAVPPTIIVLISFVPYLPIENFNERLLVYTAQFLPQDAADIFRTTYNDLMERDYNTLLSISFLLALFYASNSMKSVLKGFGHSVHMLKKIPGWKQQIISLGLLLGFTLLMAIAMGTITLSGIIVEYLQGTGLLAEEIWVALLGVIRWIVIFLLFIMIISTLYNVGNPARTRWRVFTPGALLSSIGLIVVSLLFAWYVNNFGNYNKFYGSVGTILVIMLWLYFNIVVLLLGFELNASIYHIKRKKGDDLIMIKKMRRLR